MAVLFEERPQLALHLAAQALVAVIDAAHEHAQLLVHGGHLASVDFSHCPPLPLSCTVGRGG